MGEAYFYHLTERPLGAVLPQLLELSLGRGWRVLVRGRNDAAMRALDEALWTTPPEGFLPHGLTGAGREADQPILLTTGPEPPGDRACLIAVEGAEVAPEEVAAAERVCIVFDGRNDSALERARDQWRGLTKAGCKAQYWSEETGQWRKKAES